MKCNEEMMKMVGTLFLNLALDMPAGVGRQAERLVEAKIAELEELRERINAASPSVKAPWRTTVTDAMVEAALDATMPESASPQPVRAYIDFPSLHHASKEEVVRAAIQAALETRG